MKITLVDYSILGILVNGALSGYQVRMIFEKTAMGNFSSSPGSIYPALARLQKQGLVTRKKSPETQAELFTISTAGKRALKTWVLQPVTRDDVAWGLELLLLRVAFLDSVNDKPKAKEFLISFSEAIEKYLVELEKQFETEGSHMPMSGRLAFEHGLESYRSTLKWVGKVYKHYKMKVS